MIRLFAAATVLLLASVASSGAHAEPKLTPAYQKCLAALSGQSSAGMIDCIGAELKIQDARLNRSYQAAQKRMTLPRQKAALTKAQRAWIAFRDADCASRYDAAWGTISRIEANSCVLDRTAQRIEELDAFQGGQ